MVLARYLLTRFFLHVTFITTTLTLLFNLIEFFEKMVRVKQATLQTVIHFISLNLAPSFFEILPLGTWLATCMILKELHQQDEWEALQLLNISNQYIFKVFLFAGLLLTTISFVGKEIITAHVAQSAEQFKQKAFKQNQQATLFNQWFTLDDKTFCHIHLLDLKTNTGEDFSLFELSDQFHLKKVFSSKICLLNPSTHTLTFPHAVELHTDTKKQIAVTNKTLSFPSFFSQLRLRGQTPAFFQMFHLVIFDRTILPAHIYNHLLYQFLSRLFSHLLPLLYILLTFLLFVLFPYHRYYRWILIFMPYPFVIACTTITDFLMQTWQLGLLAVIPYATLLFLIAILLRFMQK